MTGAVPCLAGRQAVRGCGYNKFRTLHGLSVVGFLWILPGFHNLFLSSFMMIVVVF